jgi:hypothetical protein
VLLFAKSEGCSVGIRLGLGKLFKIEFSVMISFLFFSLVTFCVVVLDLLGNALCAENGCRLSTVDMGTILLQCLLFELLEPKRPKKGILLRIDIIKMCMFVALK